MQGGTGQLIFERNMSEIVLIQHLREEKFVFRGREYEKRDFVRPGAYENLEDNELTF